MTQTVSLSVLTVPRHPAGWCFMRGDGVVSRHVCSQPLHLRDLLFWLSADVIALCHWEAIRLKIYLV